VNPAAEVSGFECLSCDSAVRILSVQRNHSIRERFKAGWGWASPKLRNGCLWVKHKAQVPQQWFVYCYYRSSWNQHQNSTNFYDKNKNLSSHMAGLLCFAEQIIGEQQK